MEPQSATSGVGEGWKPIRSLCAHKMKTLWRQFWWLLLEEEQIRRRLSFFRITALSDASTPGYVRLSGLEGKADIVHGYPHLVVSPESGNSGN